MPEKKRFLVKITKTDELELALNNMDVAGYYPLHIQYIDGTGSYVLIFQAVEIVVDMQGNA